MKAFNKFIFIIFLFIPLTSWGVTLVDQPDLKFNFKGYYKNIFFTSNELLTNDRFFGDLNRTRTEWDLNFLKYYSIKVIWDNEIILGDFVNTPEFALQQQGRANPFLDIDWQIAKTNNFFYGQRLYRAYFKLDIHPVLFILGQQRVDWGVMRILSPVDLFTQLSTFEIEREEKIGLPAANLMITAYPNLRINPVYAFDDDFGQTRSGLLLTQTFGSFDVSILGGRFLKDVILGFDFSGDIKKVGVRGEFIFDIADLGPDFVQLSFGLDYAFQNSAYINFEYFYNGQKGVIPLPIAVAPPTGNQIQSIHEHFLGMQIKYDLIPILTIRTLNIWDIAGLSFFINPELKYSAFDWLDFLAGVQILVGKNGGEFSQFPNVYYLQSQMFF